MSHFHELRQLLYAAATIATVTRGMSAQDGLTERSAAFDRVDRTARGVLATISCAARSARARASGALGPPDSVGRSGICVSRDGRAFGAYFTPDSGAQHALNLRVVDLDRSVRDFAAIDTTRMLDEFRAAQAGVNKAYAPYVREKLQFAPFSLRDAGDSIEVWLIPTALIINPSEIVLGGEHGLIYSPDGRTLVREIDAFDKHRLVVIPPTGPVDLISSELDVPSLTELIALNGFHDRGRAISVTTGTYRSELVGSGPGSVWLQSARHP